MDIQTLKTHIQKRSFDPYYIFTGTEWMVQKVYVDKIAEQFSGGKRSVDTSTELVGYLKKKSFSNKEYCYVLRDDKDILKDDGLLDKIASYLGHNILILLLSTVDKRLKFYKRYGSAVVEFEPLSNSVLKKYIKKEIALSDKNCDRLIEVCEQDYGRCLLEIDKIKNYVDYLGPAPMFDGVFEKLLMDGTIYKPPTDAIFDFVDQVCFRHGKKAFSLLKESYDCGESTIVLLSVLYTNIKQILQVQTCQKHDVGKSTGLTGWQIKKARERSGYYSVEELEDILRLILKVDTGIKRGLIAEDIAMDYILVNVL